jgi:benzaldehyde dehydrogenase (NAD)
MATSTPSVARLLDEDLWQGKLLCGSWRRGSAGTADVTDKATGETIGKIGVASVQDVTEACKLAKAAQPAWAATDPAERERVTRKVSQMLEQYKDEISPWLVRETGSTKFKTGFEIWDTQQHCDHCANSLKEPLKYVVQEDENFRSVAERVPIGVVGVIGPFNFPLILGMRSVAAALAMGNAVVLKPSLNTAVAGGVVIARLFEEAGLPPNLLHVLPGEGNIGAALCEDPNVAMIAFTGSTGVGKQIASKAGGLLKRVSLELGGKNPYIVLEDADVDLAASAGAFANFLHQGQICMSTGLHIVHEKIAEKYTAKLVEIAKSLKVGDPWKEQVALGPVISERQRDRIDQIVKDSVKVGAKLETGGTSKGSFYQPTVLTNVSSSMPVFREEVFGPVAAIVTFRTDDEALEIANGIDYGLSAAVQGAFEHAKAVGARIESGMVHVNDQSVNDDARAPFGGIKGSGNGTRHGGKAVIDEYTDWRWRTESKQPKRYEIMTL